MGHTISKLYKPSSERSHVANYEEVKTWHPGNMNALPPAMLDAYRFIEGRRYYNFPEMNFYLPNDDIEAVRLERQHNLLNKLFKSDFSSPVRDLLTSGTHVLDVG